MTMVKASHATAVMPAQAGIQYAAALVIEALTSGILDPRFRGDDAAGEAR
jgi:hypothetical protein